MANDSKVKLVPSSSKESEKSDISALKSVIDSAEPLDCFKPASSRQALVRHMIAYAVIGMGSYIGCTVYYAGSGA